MTQQQRHKRWQVYLIKERWRLSVKCHCEFRSFFKELISWYQRFDTYFEHNDQFLDEDMNCHLLNDYAARYAEQHLIFKLFHVSNESMLFVKNFTLHFRGIVCNRHRRNSLKIFKYSMKKVVYRNCRLVEWNNKSKWMLTNDHYTPKHSINIVIKWQLPRLKHSSNLDLMIWKTFWRVAVKIIAINGYRIVVSDLTFQ